MVTAEEIYDGAKNLIRALEAEKQVAELRLELQSFKNWALPCVNQLHNVKTMLHDAAKMYGIMYPHEEPLSEYMQILVDERKL